MSEAAPTASASPGGPVVSLGPSRTNIDAAVALAIGAAMLGQIGNKTLPFEQNEVGLIPGVLGQRLCVIGIQTTYSALYEHDFIESQVIGQTLLTVVTPPSPSPVLPAEETKPIVSKTCQKARQKVNHLTAQRNAARRAGATKSIHRLNQALREAKRKQKANC